MIRVGLDLRPTEEGFKAHLGRGTGRYATELARELLGKHVISRNGKIDLNVVPFFRESVRAGKVTSMLLQNSPIGKITFETQMILPQKLRSLGFDLLHFFSHGDAPARCRTPFVVTVLDLIPLRFKELYRANKPTWRYRLARFLEHQAIRRATGIIAISEATKKDLIEFFQIPSEKIIVTPLAAGTAFKSRDLSEDSWELEMFSQRAHFQLPVKRPVLLYVGGIDPRKNISFLLKTFAAVVKESDQDKKPILLLAGPYEKDQQYPELLLEIKTLGIEGHLRLLGFIPDDMLHRLYHAANIFVFPSLYEGFGLPVLEALASGTPVIAGNNSSLPELVGRSALLLRDGDQEQWTREILSVLKSRRRQYQMSAQGADRARLFRWSVTAEKTFEAYAHFLEMTGKPLFRDEETENQLTEKQRVAGL